MAEPSEDYSRQLLVKQRLQEQQEAEEQIIRRIFGRGNGRTGVKVLDSIDVDHLMTCLSTAESFGKQVPICNFIPSELYGAARRDMYDWRNQLTNDMKPEAAIYLDCVARKEELKRQAIEGFRRIRTGLGEQA